MPRSPRKKKCWICGGTEQIGMIESQSLHWACGIRQFGGARFFAGLSTKELNANHHDVPLEEQDAFDAEIEARQNESGRRDRTVQRARVELPGREKVLHTCLRCGADWTSLLRWPARCRHCHSARWNEPPEETISHHCQRCGADWTGRKRQPVQCPACHSAQWNRLPETMVAYHCQRCGGDWESKRKGQPVRCRYCLSPLWNKPKPPKPPPKPKPGKMLHKCLRCGWKWSNRIPRPGTCQHCRSPRWNEVKK